MTFQLDDIALCVPPNVPWPWRISWSHFATPVANRDTEQLGESIFCAKCGEYVIELAMWKMGEAWAYVVNVNDGPYCGDDFLINERITDPALAISTLQYHLDNIAQRCIEDGSAIAAITVSDTHPLGITCHFNPPQGQSLLNPHPYYVRSLLWLQSGSFWLGGSGDAAVTFKNADGQTISELIFLLREPYGVYMLFQQSEMPALVAASSSIQKQSDEITVTLSGAPLTLPKHYFIKRSTAADIVTHYIEIASGVRPPYDNWQEQ